MTRRDDSRERADKAIPIQTSVSMRIASRILGARARKTEGTPVDLARQRRQNDAITDRLLRVPRGIAEMEEVIGHVPVVRFSSGGTAGTVMYIHGGGYALGSARQGAGAARISAGGGPDLVSVEYRLAPEHPHPAAVDDAIAVYRDLLRTAGPARLVVAGESAGGGLALLLLQRARDAGLPMPAGLAVSFPWADLTMSGASSTTNVGKDMLVRSELVQEASWFAGGTDIRSAAVSPLFGSFHGFPRTHIAVGTHDLLLDDSRRVATAMTSAGVDVQLDEWPGAIHGFTAIRNREGRTYERRLHDFISTALTARGPATPEKGHDHE